MCSYFQPPNCSNHRSRVLIFMLLLLTTISCKQTQRDEDVLAYINELEINEAHFESAFKEVYYRSGRSLPANFNTKKAILESEFRTYVLATHARDLGFDSDQVSQRQKGVIERKVLSEEYLQKSVLDHIHITEADLREIFLRFNTTLRASHLYAADKTTADSLWNMLEQGADFDQLAYETFQDPYLKNNGGDLGEFQTDEMDIAFENAAHLLEVGDYSKPVRTSQGYSIVKLTDRYVRPVITEYEYANQKANLTRFVKRRKQQEVTRSHLLAITDNFEVKQDMANWLWKWSNEKRELFESNDPELMVAAGNADAPLIRLEDFTFTVSDFFEETYFTPEVTRSRIRTRSKFDDYIKGLAYRKYAVKQAREMGIDKDEMVRGSINQTYYVFLQDRSVDYLREQIEISEEEIRKTYFDTPERFVTPIELDLSRIVTKTEAEANAAIEALNADADFETVFRQYSTRIQDYSTEGRMGYVPLTQLGNYGPILSKLSEGDVSRALQYQTGEYHVYKVHGRIESRPMNFEEAAVMIEPFLRKKKLEKLVEETVEDVKLKHNAFIDEEAIRDFTFNL